MKEDLKYGEKYRLELLCKSQTKNIIIFETPTGGLLPLDVNDLECVSPVPERENTEPAPKYDPCRLFRKGDIVEVKEDIDGRNLHAFTTGLTLGKLYTVEEDEKDCKLKIKNDDGYGIYAFVHFKLVTPVEETEQYSIETCQYGYTVNKGELILATYNDENHPHAKESAEAERDRLNAEHRKENA